jgi:hypothetical protein
MRPVSAALDAKLGRCARCMRWSAGLCAGWLLLLGALITAGASKPLILGAIVPATAFITLFIAHAVAYLVRPAPVKGCLSCAEKAKARRRAARRRRLWSWSPRQRAAEARRRARSCRTCGKRRSAEELSAMADELPPANEELRGLVESSPEFQSLLPRLAALEPVDTWQADMRQHFVYQLRSDGHGPPASALLVASWDNHGLISAVEITPDPEGAEPRVTDLMLLRFRT